MPAYFAVALIPGWIFLLFADCLVDGFFLLRSRFKAAPPERRPAAFFLAGSAAPLAVLGLWALARGGGLAAVPVFAALGLASGAAALALNRLCGRWWRLGLCIISMVTLIALA